MPNTTILLIRHGQTDWNVARRFQGQTDIPLNATGIAQAQDAAAALKNESFDGIFSSDLLRAYRTAEIIAESHQLPITTDKRLREMSFGTWEGLAWAEIEQQYPEETAQWRQRRLSRPPQGESLAELATRTTAFLDSLRGKGGRYVVVAHGGTLVSMMSAALGIAPERAFQLRADNVSISEITLSGDVTLLNRWNDTHHLRKQASIRPIALAIFLHQQHILVAKFSDPLTQQTFYRPMGGGIEFGETTAQTLQREIHEELAAEISDIAYVGTLENIFTYNGQQGHELMQVCCAQFIDPSWYDLQKEITAAEAGLHAVWMPLAAFTEAGSDPLYPEGLLDLLREQNLT